MRKTSLLPLANALAAAVAPTRAWRFRQRAFRVAGVQLSGAAKIGGGCTLLGPNIAIGDSWVGLGTSLISTEAASVQIGDRCDIGPGVLMTVGTHDFGPASRRAGTELALPIRVGDGCWIGARATILAGVTVGDGSVVAAGALVAQDVPPNTLVAGVPARVVRELDSP